MTSLANKTYELLKKVPAGRVTTYKALADALGTKAYRVIGQFMRHNPYAFSTCHDLSRRTNGPERSRRIPCHRVVASDGSIGGFMGKTQGPEIQKKIDILAKEGVKVVNNRVVDFDSLAYRFR